MFEVCTELPGNAGHSGPRSTGYQVNSQVDAERYFTCIKNWLTEFRTEYKGCFVLMIQDGVELKREEIR